MLRGGPASPQDLRKKQPHDVVRPVDFDIPVGTNGDTTTAIWCARGDAQSNRIIKQCVDWLRANPGR